MTRLRGLGVCAGLAWVVLSGVAQATTLEFWYLDAGWTHKDVMQRLLADFTQQTGIAIDLRPLNYNNINEKLPVAVAAGTAPDIATVDSTMPLVWGLANKILEPMGPYVQEGFAQGFKSVGHLQQEMTWAGQIYGLPFDFQLRGLFWNKDHFGDAGLDPDRVPATMDELDAAAVKLTKQAADGGISQLGFYPLGGNWNTPGWIWTFGGEMFNWTTGAITVAADPNNLRTFEWMAEYGKRYPAAAVSQFISQNGGGLKAFESGKISVQMQAATFIPDMEKGFPDLHFGTGRVPLPPGGHNGVWPGGMAVIVPSGSKHPAEVAQLVSFLMRSQTAQQWFELTGQSRFPADARVVAQLVNNLQDPLMRNMVAQATDLNARPPLWGTFNSTMSQAGSDVLNLKKTPKQALADAQLLLEDALNKAGVTASIKAGAGA